MVCIGFDAHAKFLHKLYMYVRHVLTVLTIENCQNYTQILYSVAVHFFDTV